MQNAAKDAGKNAGKKEFLSIVIAVYNEEDNVVPLTKRICKCIGGLGIPFALIYVIDGADKSYERLLEFKKQRRLDNLLLDHSVLKRGFRNAFVKGFSMMPKATTMVMTLDADLNHQPEEAHLFFEAMRKTGADLVIGSRYGGGSMERGVPAWKRGISKVANVIIDTAWGLKVKDKTSGYRLYRRELIDKVVPRTKAQNFEVVFEILLVATRMGFKAVEVPIVFKARTHGVSKFELGKVVRGYARLLFRR